ncbi:MAG: lamin tail domain-containing protein [Bacteroidales bacterium]|nr:lamin tail domain-containing protein [Bacteroidales bacterium]
MKKRLSFPQGVALGWWKIGRYLPLVGEPFRGSGRFYWWILFALFFPVTASAQVFDDFFDGDFTMNPTWVGTDTCFKINNSYQLQSSATTAGDAWLVTVIARSEALRSDEAIQPEQSGLLPVRLDCFAPLRSARNDVTEWRFWLRENFSPSANNYAEVWLCADTTALPFATRGYFLRFGSTGSQDAIELYRKDPSGETLICKGSDATIASSFKVAVKVKRSADGHWTIATDYDNIGNYIVEGEGIDETYPVEGYFGFSLHFTSSNAKKFYFDDIYIGPEIIDTVPPELLRLEVQDSRHLLLTFSEPLDESALDPQHYDVEAAPRRGAISITPGQRAKRAQPGAIENLIKNQGASKRRYYPDTVSFFETLSKILLTFNEPLPENTNLILQISDITDLSGNVMPPTEWPFAIYHAEANDVVINEIMADPTPVVGLPEWEYVELFNTTPYTIDLKDWTFLIGNTSKTFSSTQIEPQGFLILCKTDAEQELNTYGPTCGFSSFSIANAGATLKLVSPDETLVSEVSFNDSWYHDADKRDGGWSLEQIDPFNPCAGTVNWSASTDLSGGTPGRENSINAPNEITPTVARVSMLGDNMVLLWFDQQMNRESLNDPSKYLVMELDLHPIEVICNPVESSSLELLFDYHFEEGAVYTLVLNDLESCSGQPIASDTQINFGIPNEISEGDILLNEILFDPITPGVDYVELYNHSDKTFDLSELKLGVIKESFPNPADTTLKEITPDSRLMMPNSYVLLSTDGYTVCQQYQCEPNHFVDMASFPSYPNSGGIALLMSRKGVVVDQMTYNEQMHYPLLKETKGVSLERVLWEVPSDQPDNWHSASEASGFGTPGYINSAHSTQNVHSTHSLTVSPPIFSPDGDSFDDTCLFSYQLESSGGTMNAYVFSAEGRLVRHLVKGELVAQEGCFVWNGLDSRGLKVPIGIYVVVTEVFDMEGNVRRYENAVAVASK